MKLTDKQDKFARVYVETGNASEAYRQAYPRSKAWKDKSVHEEASKLLANPKVAPRVEELKALREEEFKAEAKRQGIDAETVIREQAYTAFFDIRELFDADGRLLPAHSFPEHVARAVKSVKIKGVKTDDGSVKGVVAEITMNDKLAALHHIGEHIGMYKQVREHHWADDLATMTEEELAAEERRIDAELARAMEERKRTLAN